QRPCPESRTPLNQRRRESGQPGQEPVPVYHSSTHHATAHHASTAGGGDVEPDLTFLHGDHRRVHLDGYSHSRWREVVQFHPHTHGGGADVKIVGDRSHGGGFGPRDQARGRQHGHVTGTQGLRGVLVPDGEGHG